MERICWVQGHEPRDDGKTVLLVTCNPTSDHLPTLDKEKCALKELFMGSKGWSILCITQGSPEEIFRDAFQEAKDKSCPIKVLVYMGHFCPLNAIPGTMPGTTNQSGEFELTTAESIANALIMYVAVGKRFQTGKLVENQPLNQVSESRKTG